MMVRSLRLLSVLIPGTLLLASLKPILIWKNSAMAANTYSFQGRRGAVYTATWDPVTYEIVISTPDGTFPWDWISFVGNRGAISLAGNNQVAQTLAFSSAISLDKLQAGDIMRVKAWDRLSLAHLSKIGLVIGSGPSAQRAWLGDGTIMDYELAPDYAGYRVSVLGRIVRVKLSHLQTGSTNVTGVIGVQIDDPTNARLYFASDLEPIDNYQQAVEYRNSSSTTLGFDAGSASIWGQGAGGVRAYVYASLPLESWSANNLTYDQYLNADILDGLILGGSSDGRVALVVQATDQQFFYIGTNILDTVNRPDPTILQQELDSARLSKLQALPRMSAAAMPGFDFVNILSNLFLSYLVNPDGNIHYTDKVFPYAPDNLMAMVEVPYILPLEVLSDFRDYLELLSTWQYTSPSQGVYWRRADVPGNPSLPSWYSGNFPDIVYRGINNVIGKRYQYSDLYATAEYLTAIANYYRATGDLAMIQSHESGIRVALAALQTYNSAYDSQFGEDGHLYPHLIVPMGDLARIEGVYPGESATAIYAYEDAAFLLETLGDAAGADDLRNHTVAPMRQGYDQFFWDTNADYLLPRRDARSETGSGTTYQDFWANTMHAPLQGDMADEYLSSMLATFTSSVFLDGDNNYRWLSIDSENYSPDSQFTNGYVMEGGFFNGAPNVAPAIAYYQLGQTALGDQAANRYFFNVWTRMGPYETMRQWSTKPPGLYLETSIYIEPLVSTLWLLKEALGVIVQGRTVTISPLLEGEFSVHNLHLISQGFSAVVDYSRDRNGCESVQVLSNSGLNIMTPNAGNCPPLPTGTSIPSSTATPMTTSTVMGTPSPTPDLTTPASTATATISSTITYTPTTTPIVVIPTPAVHRLVYLPLVEVR